MHGQRVGPRERQPGVQRAQVLVHTDLGARHEARHNGESPRKDKARTPDNEADKARRRDLGFLLYDPTQAGEVDNEDSDAETGIGDVDDEVDVYPNPATATSYVEFNVRQQGPVRVELINASGQVVKLLHQDQHAAGPLKLPVDLGPESGKFNTVRITDAKGARTQSIIR